MAKWNNVDLYDLYFYKGKFRTEEGLKRALIKDGTIYVSSGTFYRIPSLDELCYPYDYLEDIVTEKRYVDRKGFRKWLTQEIREGRCQVLRNQRFYSSDYTDNVGTDLYDCLDCIVDAFYYYDPKYPDDFIERSETTWENYAQTLEDKDWERFKVLPDSSQMRIAMKWRIAMYNNDIGAEK